MMIRILQSPWLAACLGNTAFMATLVAVWHPISPPVADLDKEATQRNSVASWTLQNPEMEQLVAELKKEKEAAATRQKELNELAARLDAERAELSRLTQTVHQVQAEFDRNVTRVREEESANLKKLAKTYATMSPEGAASVFKALDDTTVVKVLTFMKDSDIAPVLEALARQSAAEAKRVASICERLRLAMPEAKKAPTS